MTQRISVPVILIIALCPLPHCEWKTMPMIDRDEAQKSRRIHFRNHSHDELVEFVEAVVLDQPEYLEFYERRGA